MKIIAAVILLAWAFCGGCGVLTCKSRKTNWFMVVFMLTAPFLALLELVI